MRTIFALLLLLVCVSARGAFTEFYANSGGTNVNAGSTTNATPLFSTTAGDWVAATGVYTKAGSDLSAVTAGMWASVYVDGATTAAFIGRITTVNDGADTITVSTTIKTGTAPADGTGTRSIRVGGAWQGPWVGGANSDAFPFSLVNNLMTNLATDVPRVNFKNFDFNSCTNIVQNSNGPIRFQGYGTNAGDGGFSYFINTGNGAGFAMCTINGNNIDVVDLGFTRNGISGNAVLLTMAGNEGYVRGCLFSSSRGVGLQVNQIAVIEECEAQGCNAVNATQGAYSLLAAGTVARRCVAQGNTGTGTSGFVISSGVTLQDCIAANNGRDGVTASSSTGVIIYGCDFYTNGTNGINLTGAAGTLVNIENCTFLRNGAGLAGAFAINSSGSLVRNGAVINCAFGTGTTATNGNGSANILPGTTLEEIGSIGLAADVSPWVDAAAGNFTKTNTVTTLLGTARGRFLAQAGPLFVGTTSFPDIGATQISNSLSGVIAYPLYRR
jgi:hypothetical protein